LEDKSKKEYLWKAMFRRNGCGMWSESECKNEFLGKFSKKWTEKFEKISS
jgi:hypothetical protein